MAVVNFLAHLLLTDDVQLPLAGAVLGDYVRGPVDGGRYPPDLARSIRLHRRVDTVTDSHPLVLEACARFPTERRRYASILLDMILDHCLALDWAQYSAEPLAHFTARSARAVADASPWFQSTGSFAPPSFLFNRLLQSYRSPAGLSRAIHRTAHRLSRPQGMIAAAEGWREHVEPSRALLPVLIADLRTASRNFVAETAETPAVRATGA